MDKRKKEQTLSNERYALSQIFNKKYIVEGTDVEHKRPGKQKNKIVIPRDELFNDLSKRMTRKEIGKKYNMHEETIRRLLKHYDLVGENCPTVKLNKARDKRIVELYIKGHSTMTIEKMIIISRTTIARILVDNNIKLRPSNSKNVLMNSYRKGPGHRFMGSPKMFMEQVLSNYRRGMNMNQSAKDIGCGRECVKRRLKKLGLYERKR